MLGRKLCRLGNCTYGGGGGGGGRGEERGREGGGGRESTDSLWLFSWKEFAHHLVTACKPVVLT